LSDLSTIQREVAPLDLKQLQVATTYLYGVGESANYHRALGAEMSKMDPSITMAEIHQADDSAHFKNTHQLAVLIDQRWDQVCASA
jgi:hypothetical protein